MEKFMKATMLEKLDQMKSPSLGNNQRFLNPSCSKNAEDFKEWNPPIVSENLVLLVAHNFYIDDLFNRLQYLFYPKIISYENMIFFDFTLDEAKIEKLKLSLDEIEIQSHLNHINLYQVFNVVTSQEHCQVAQLHQALFFFWNLLYSSIIAFELNDEGIRFYVKENSRLQGFDYVLDNPFSFQALLNELQEYNFDFCSELEFLLAFADFLHPQVLYKEKKFF